MHKNFHLAYRVTLLIRSLLCSTFGDPIMRFDGNTKREKGNFDITLL